MKREVEEKELIGETVSYSAIWADYFYIETQSGKDFYYCDGKLYEGFNEEPQG